MAGIDGVREAEQLFNGIAPAAAHELADMLGRLGRDLRAEQAARAARDTGALAGGLSVELLTERLKVRVGLLNTRRGRSTLFYGRFVERGRTAMTVVVTRRVKQRKVKGNGRNGTTRRVLYAGASARLRRRGPNKGTAIGSPYKMRVAALPARPFVRFDGWEQRADAALSEFWSKVLARAGNA